MWRRLVFTIFLLPCTASAESYGECRGRLIEAYQASDFDQMVSVANQCLEIRPDYPAMRYNLAMAQVLAGEHDAAIETLEKLLANEVFFDIQVEPFDRLASHRRYQEFSKGFEAIGNPAGSATVAYRYHEPDFVPEGIAFDSRDNTIYLGSIRNAKIVKLDADGTYKPFATTFNWSVFGMRIDPGKNELWVATAAVPQGATTPPQEIGETEILRFNLADGSLLRRYRLPRENQTEQVLGDLLITDDGIYTTDSLGGAVYLLDPASGEFRVVVQPGTFTSPQGLVESADGKSVYLADYRGGLFRIALENHELHPVTVDGNAVLYGIDGLYRHGKDLVAIQNGIQPHRVVRIALNASGDTSTAVEILVSGLAEFDEPTLGQVIDDTFLFVANSHWNRFNADNQLVNADQLTGPIILRIQLQ